MINNIILNYLTLIWVIIGIIIFFILLKINAPYGRFARKGWGKLIDSRLGFFLMEFISPILFFVLFVAYTKKIQDLNLVLIVFLIFWESAYLYRALIYPFLRKKEKKITLSIILFSMCFNSINVFLIVTSIFYSKYTMNWFFDIRFILGSIIFIIGYYINVKSDFILSEFKNSNKDKIPRKFLFNQVSSPHYLGEIIKWIGFALMIWTWAGLSFVIWTCANLIPRAMDHHKWYIEHFKNYPRERAALIPRIL